MELRAHQIRSIENISGRKRVLFTAQMGAGKTVITLSCVAKWGGKTLIVAPLRVAQTVWAEECEKWEHLKHLQCTKLLGSPDKRKRLLDTSTAQIFVINKDNLRWLINQIKDKPDWLFDNLVIDESTCIKNHASKIFKEAILPYVYKYQRVVLLSGTPSPNGYLDLWSQMYALDAGEALGRRITHYREKYFRQNPYSLFQWTMRKGADKAIQEKTKHLAYNIRVPRLPTQIIDQHVELDKKASRAYRDMEKDFIHGGIAAGSSAVALNKMLQICNGFLYDSEDEEGHMHFHDDKIEQIKAIREDNPTENLLVAYNFKYDRDRLLKAFPRARLISDTGALEQWNAGSIPMLLASPRSAGHGLNLQFGGAVCVWFGLTWSLEEYKQFNARLARPGQKKTVRIIRLLTRDTVESKVLGSLLQKDNLQEDLLTSISRGIENAS